MIIQTPDGPVDFGDLPEEEIRAILRRKFPPESARSQIGGVMQGFGAEAEAPPQDQAAYDTQIQQGMQESQPGRRNEAAGAAYEALPGYARPFQAASDLLTVGARLPAAGLTGVASGIDYLKTGKYDPITPEEVIARLRTGQTTGPQFDAEVAKQKQIYEDAAYRSGWAGTVAQIAATAGMPIARIFGAGKPLLNTMTTGAAGGAATAAGSEENPLLGAAGGAAGAVGGHVLGQGLGYGLQKGLGYVGDIVEAISPKLAKVTGLKVPKAKPPMTVDEFKVAASAKFKEAEDQGVIFNTQGIQDLRARVIKDFEKRSYDPGNEPGVVPFLNRLDEYTRANNVTFEGLLSLRRLASNGYRPGMGSNNALVAKAIDRIDEMVAKMNPNHMAASGNAAVASQAAKDARELYHRGAKLQTIQTLIQRGEDIGESNVSRNVPVAVRKQLLTIVNPRNPKAGRGFTQLEKDLIRKTSRRGTTEDIAHAAAGLLPRDRLTAAMFAGDVIQNATAALYTGGASLPITAALTVGRLGAGYVGHKVSAGLAQKSVDELVHLIATGKTTKQAAMSVLQNLSEAKRAAVLAGLSRVGAATGIVTQPLNDPEIQGSIGRLGGRISNRLGEL